MNKSTYVYTTFIRTTPERLWSALTDPAFIPQYWFGYRCKSDWAPGYSWTMSRSDGQLSDSGEIVEIIPPHRLVLKWRNEVKEELKAEGYSRCTFALEPMPDTDPQVVKLTVTHEIDVADSKFIQAVAGGWPGVLSNLKSVLETGAPVLRAL